MYLPLLYKIYYTYYKIDNRRYQIKIPDIFIIIILNEIKKMRVEKE